VSSPYPASYAPRFKVTVGGTEFNEYNGMMTDVVADTVINGASRCSFRLTNPFDHEQGSFSDLTWDNFSPGTTVKIAFGHGEGSSATTEIFKGAIETVRPEFERDRPPSVQVTGYSKMRKLMMGSNSKSWENTSIGDIVSGVATNELDSCSTSKASTKPSMVYQDDQSHFRFIMQLAEKYGFEFFESKGAGTFQPKGGGSSPGEASVTLYYGESLESFSGELRRPDHGKVEVRHWDESEESAIAKTASNENGSGKHVYRIPVDSKSEATAIAKAKLEENRIEGVAESFGNASVTAGTVIKLKGIGSKFSGKYYVTRATHRFDNAGYNMSLEVLGL